MGAPEDIITRRATGDFPLRHLAEKIGYKLFLGLLVSGDYFLSAKKAERIMRENDVSLINYCNLIPLTDDATLST